MIHKANVERVAQKEGIRVNVDSFRYRKIVVPMKNLRKMGQGTTTTTTTDPKPRSNQNRSIQVKSMHLVCSVRVMVSRHYLTDGDEMAAARVEGVVAFDGSDVCKFLEHHY